MKNFIAFPSSETARKLISDGLELKKNPLSADISGTGKTLCMVFFNASLRTRLSTQKAAQNLGMHAIVLNIGSEGWAIEFEEGAIMNGSTVEHIKDAAAVIGLYCDILAIRSFPSLINKSEDDAEKTLNAFIKYSKVPVISMESATLHPLQSLADMITIEETKHNSKPKVVLTWAPHVKALPQVVANSFAQWSLGLGYDLTIAHPEGYTLSENFTKGAILITNQEQALKDADFVYVKNWSSYTSYGKILDIKEDWLLSEKKMLQTNNAKIMHCLPVRRNVELPDELLDSPQSLVLRQAENRIYAAQSVLKSMLVSNF